MPPAAPLPPLRKPSRPPTRKANLPNQKLLRFLGGAFLRRISAKRKLRKLENNLLTNHHGCANIIRPWGYSSAGSPVHSVTYPKVNFIKISFKVFPRGYSSAGRALEWHSRGQRFDPAYLHQKAAKLSNKSLFSSENRDFSFAFGRKSWRKTAIFARFKHTPKKVQAIALKSSPQKNCARWKLNAIFNLYPLPTSTRLMRQFTIIFFVSILAES